MNRNPTLSRMWSIWGCEEVKTQKAKGTIKKSTSEHRTRMWISCPGLEMFVVKAKLPTGALLNILKHSFHQTHVKHLFCHHIWSLTLLLHTIPHLSIYASWALCSRSSSSTKFSVSSKAHSIRFFDFLFIGILPLQWRCSLLASIAKPYEGK